MDKHKIAVIGSGISGLASAWLLGRAHAVTLFEADTRAGGHSNTVDVGIEGVTHAVDTGFLVHNDRTYPNLIALFSELGIRTISSDMSFSVRVEEPEVEWCGSHLGTVFAQPRNLARPQFWSMLSDILRFNRSSVRLIEATRDRNLSLGELIESEGYGSAFRDWYLLPMGAAIWSTPTRRILDFPAHPFLCFCSNHGLLQVRDRPQWKTIPGGSRRYVERMLAAIPEVHLGTPVRAIRREEHGVRLMTDRDDILFDQVVIASHSDQALGMLDNPDPAEREILGAVQYQPNRAVLHTDRTFLPRRQRAWAAWNYQAGNIASEEKPVSVTYLLNRLQPLPFEQTLMLTLNPHREPLDSTIIRSFDYAHPLLDRKAWDAQARLPEIQGKRRTWFAGAWTGYGFHEDGLRSAMRVANALGVLAPWQNRAIAS